MYEAIIIHLKEEDKDHIDEEAIKTKIKNFSFKVQSKDKNGKEEKAKRENQFVDRPYCLHFSRANEFLIKNDKTPIDWQIENI